VDQLKKLHAVQDQFSSRTITIWSATMVPQKVRWRKIKKGCMTC